MSANVMIVSLLPLAVRGLSDVLPLIIVLALAVVVAAVVIMVLRRVRR